MLACERNTRRRVCWQLALQGSDIGGEAYNEMQMCHKERASMAEPGEPRGCIRNATRRNGRATLAAPH